METKRRSLVKSLSWRVFATLITMAVTLVVTRKLIFAIEIGVADTVIKFVTYFFHERMWSRISYGIEPDKAPGST